MSNGTMVEFSESDLLRNKIVTPAWYTLFIQTVGEWTPSANKEKPSNNLVVDCIIERNGDDGTEEFKGVPITVRFNSRAIGFVEGFLRALGVEVTAGRFNIKAAEGQRIDAYIGNKLYEGRTMNNCENKFRAPKAA